ncbi:hypothetical protein ACWERV_17205 [Streptomyces sp. NPDC004031]
MTLPTGVTTAVYEEALADVVTLRPYGTYQPKPELLPPTTGPECGSRRGYNQHRAGGEQTCERCRAAETARARRLRTTGTTVATAQGGEGQ